MTHICIGRLSHHWFKQWLVAWPAPCLNQCLNIVIWNPRNKLQWNFNQNWRIFIEENAFGNVICEMAAILSWPQCVNGPAGCVCSWGKQEYGWLVEILEMDSGWDQDGLRFYWNLGTDSIWMSSDKMVIRLSYLHTGISCTGKMISLYWTTTLVPPGECGNA